MSCRSGYHIISGGKCVKDCTIGVDNCDACSNIYTCEKCADGYRIASSVCEKCTDTNCIECSENKDICTKCKGQHYLHTIGESITCAYCSVDYNSYNPNTDTYLCGNQTKNTCDTSKVGYSLDFDNGDIIISFASNLGKILEKKNFSIKLSDGTNYSTENCSLAMESMIKYTIHTDLRECDLPIFIDLKFSLI
ncbi:unnamed protein product [Blepharisma stoltei]|uniref:Uncharacterized protein n=1 Tax=Blepharisma stoltei TaxID=1481888 RepID=A0AAU9J9E6_9CILI|nr:unnamed protein product [Blepharisma stoltei]